MINLQTILSVTLVGFFWAADKHEGLNRITEEPAIEREEAGLGIMHTILEGPAAETTARPTVEQTSDEDAALRHAGWNLLEQLAQGPLTAEERAQIINLCLQQLARH